MAFFCLYRLILFRSQESAALRSQGRQAHRSLTLFRGIVPKCQLLAQLSCGLAWARCRQHWPASSAQSTRYKREKKEHMSRYTCQELLTVFLTCSAPCLLPSSASDITLLGYKVTLQPTVFAASYGKCQEAHSFTERASL